MSMNIIYNSQVPLITATLVSFTKKKNSILYCRCEICNSQFHLNFILTLKYQIGKIS